MSLSLVTYRIQKRAVRAFYGAWDNHESEFLNTGRISCVWIYLVGLLLWEIYHIWPVQILTYMDKICRIHQPSYSFPRAFLSQCLKALKSHLETFIMHFSSFISKVLNAFYSVTLVVAEFHHYIATVVKTKLLRKMMKLQWVTVKKKNLRQKTMNLKKISSLQNCLSEFDSTS